MWNTIKQFFKSLFYSDYLGSTVYSVVLVKNECDYITAETLIITHNPETAASIYLGAAKDYAEHVSSGTVYECNTVAEAYDMFDNEIVYVEQGNGGYQVRVFLLTDKLL